MTHQNILKSKNIKNIKNIHNFKISKIKYSMIISAIFFLCISFGYVFYMYIFTPLYQKINFSGIVFMQIARGDAFYLKTKEGVEIIWDGGYDKSFLYKLSDYRPFFDKTIDLWIITHPDSDHYYGGLEVLKQLHIKNIMLTGVDKNDAKYKEIFTIAKQKNINIIFADKSKNLKIGDIVLDTLYPFESIYASRDTEEVGNDFCIVQKLHFMNKNNKKITLLLTGDIEQKTELKLLLSGIDLSADILKIAHHGSKSSSSENFLKAVNPKRAIITTGTENTFNHPHVETLNILKKLKIKFINSKYGDVVIEF